MAGKGKRPTKAEAAARELHDALAWPSSPEPERLSDKAVAELLIASAATEVRLWTFNLGGHVELGATNGRDHNSSGRMNKNNFNSRGIGGPWYSTREGACLAMRWAMTRKAAQDLMSVDGRIASLLAGPLPGEAPDAGMPSPSQNP